jgi:uncharacterized LabA/DUF88 family protein/cold shock CspA family protein
MLKAGIFVDVENVIRNGGYEIDYRSVKELVEAQQAAILRANAYFAIDEDREAQDFDVGKRRRNFRNMVRKWGYHVVEKPIKKYANPDGTMTYKGNSDLDLAIDALLQAENLDYVLLVSGDGDFAKLVSALQTKGKRVDVLSFSNTSGDLIRSADYYFDGYLVPDMLPIDEGFYRGYMHSAVAEKGYGFITYYESKRPDAIRDDLFVHISDVAEANASNMAFGRLLNQTLEFQISRNPDGRDKAINVRSFKPSIGG